jgi:hypothetical protein
MDRLTPIDADTLERMARIARGFPGRTVSVAMAAEGAQRTQLRIDGVAAAEIVERCEHDE